jgi:hypothetical protein
MELRLPATDEVIGHIVAMHPPLDSRCQQRGGWTTRVSAPYIDSSVGNLGNQSINQHITVIDGH